MRPKSEPRFAPSWELFLRTEKSNRPTERCSSALGLGFRVLDSGPPQLPPFELDLDRLSPQGFHVDCSPIIDEYPTNQHFGRKAIG